MDRMTKTLLIVGTILGALSLAALLGGLFIDVAVWWWGRGRVAPSLACWSMAITLIYASLAGGLYTVAHIRSLAPPTSKATP